MSPVSLVRSISLKLLFDVFLILKERNTIRKKVANDFKRT